jgi:hypothetical protein
VPLECNSAGFRVEDESADQMAAWGWGARAMGQSHPAHHTGGAMWVNAGITFPVTFGNFSSAPE